MKLEHHLGVENISQKLKTINKYVSNSSIQVAMPRNEFANKYGTFKFEYHIKASTSIKLTYQSTASNCGIVIIFYS